MWHGGLRLGEVEELRLEDLALPNRKLMVRQGKCRKDRAIYLTDTAVRAVQEYLIVRGQGADDHVFLYRHLPVCKDLLHCRIKAAGQRVGVKVTPHQLRHTCATQLLNAGCKITSIQQLLGHRKLDSTLIYARVHDETVASDYYAAMARIEKSLEIPAKSHDVKEQANEDTIPRVQLLAVIEQLAVPQLRLEVRLDLVAQMRHLLNGQTSQPALAVVC
jgi:site-specific recombinase XerC